ncbi:MAG TPA: murein biosynthesis integral membrane protein MurJ [Anaerolineales bacterium]
MRAPPMQVAADRSSANQQIARAAGTVMLAIVLGQLLGLLRGILVARAFPPTELDAFFAANRVSETLFMLIAAGALGSAFIPTFTGMLARGDRRAAWRLASSLANLILLILSTLALVAAILAPAIVRYLLAPGFSDDAALFGLTVELLRIQLISVVFFGLGGLIVGVLNANGVFFIPALTPSMYQLGLIFGVLVLSPSMGIRGLAWGVVGGAALYLLLQVPALLRLRHSPAPGAGPHYTPTLGLGEASVREVLRLMLPRIVGIGVVQLNFWVNTWLASQMQSGSVAGLQYGFSLMLMAQAAIAQSVAIAAMPTFSAQHALGQIGELRSSLTAALRGVVILAAPAAAGLIILREPIVKLLYERGHFDANMTGLVSWALLWFAAGLVGHSMLEVLTRAFYAQHDTRTPVIVGATAMALNILFSFAFSAAFAQAGWLPHGGLALANSTATALEMSALYLLMRRRLGTMDDGRIAQGLGVAAAGTAALVAALVPFAHLQLPAWVTALAGVAIGAAVYSIVMVVMRVPELSALLRGLKRRLDAIR